MEVTKNLGDLSLSTTTPKRFIIIGKLKGRYLLLELFLNLDESAIFKFLQQLSQISRQYLIEMYKFIKNRRSLSLFGIKCEKINLFSLPDTTFMYSNYI